jgi:hypothetical protein
VPPADRSIAEYAYWSGARVCFAVPRESTRHLIEAVRRGLGWYPLNVILTDAAVEDFEAVPGRLLTQADREAIRSRATGIMVSTIDTESLILAWRD